MLQGNGVTMNSVIRGSVIRKRRYERQCHKGTYNERVIRGLYPLVIRKELYKRQFYNIRKERYNYEAVL